MIPIIIPQRLGVVVANTATKLNRPVYYYHGHPLEIIETLRQRDEGDNPEKKYPAICLFQDFIEDIGKERGIGSAAPSLRILIVNSTSPEYKAAQRYTNNFIPNLYPIYIEFLNQIRVSGFVMIKSGELIPHKKIDRVFWGKQGLYGVEGNVFNDYLDAIEIYNMELKFYNNIKC